MQELWSPSAAFFWFQMEVVGLVILIFHILCGLWLPEDGEVSEPSSQIRHLVLTLVPQELNGSSLSGVLLTDTYKALSSLTHCGSRH